MLGPALAIDIVPTPPCLNLKFSSGNLLQSRGWGGGQVGWRSREAEV